MQRKDTHACETLTTQELEALLRALAHTRQPFTEEDLACVTAWAEETRMRSALLSLALEGAISLSVKDGEVYFQRHD